MSTTQQTTNKAAIRRFRDAVNTGDLELISKTIDEVVERVFSEMRQLGVIAPAVATGEAV